MASITDGNYLVSNQGKNPLVNFNFMLRVELLFDLPCKSVRSFSRELEYDFIQEGGLNDYVHMRRKPITRPFTLEVERYVGVDYIDPLPLGADLVLPIILFVSRSPSQFIPFVVARTYVFTGCTVMKKTYGDLVADNSGLLVETTTIGYREMLCVDIPWSEVGDNIFASTPTSPVSAVTANKTAEDLKLQGQQYYDQALAAKTKAEGEFSEANTDEIITKLKDAIAKLEAAAGENGAFSIALADAEKNLNSPSGESYKEIANKSRLAMTDAANALREAAALKARKESLKKHAQDKVKNLEDEEKDRKQRIDDLNAQIEKDKEEIAEIEEKLPEALREVSAAEEAVEKAEGAYGEARTKLSLVEREYVEARREFSKYEEAKNRDEEGEDSAPSEEYKNANAVFKEKEAEFNEAQNELNDAKEVFESAEADLAASKRLSALKEKNDNSTQKIKDTEAELQLTAEKLAAAEKELEAAAEEADDAANAEAEANTALTVATEKADKDNAAAEEADKKFAQARTKLNQAKQKISPMQNSLTNLEKRKEKTQNALTHIEEAMSDCKTENDKLQQMSDSPISPLRTSCDLVHQHMRNVLVQEQQARELGQYIDVANDLLADAAPFIQDETQQ